MSEQFWLRWRKEYLLLLQNRQKWFKEKRNLREGDIVMLKNENEARCHWPLAKVIKVKLSVDGLVRSVLLKIGEKSLERPLSKLIMILEDETDVSNGSD